MMSLLTPTCGSLPVVSIKNEFPISQETLERAKKLVLENPYPISHRYSDEHFRFYFDECDLGSVFSHVDFPGLIMTVMSKEGAETCFTNMETARGIVKDYALDCCFIPKPEMIALDDDTALLVMENLPRIMDESNAYHLNFKMVSECEYALFEERAIKWKENFIDFGHIYAHPEVKLKWQKYFTQAAELIAKTGYWHASWYTILLDKDRGFSFVNFKATSPTHHCIRLGIEGLLKIAPHDFYDEIASIAKRHGVCIDIQALKINRKAILEMIAGIRKWHATHSITPDSGVINTHLLNPEADYEAREKGVVHKLSQHLKGTQNINLVEQRKFSYQPLQYDGYTRSEFEKILKNLWNKQIICAYTSTPNSCGYEKLRVYNIYF
jgi:hypothetical protein